MSVGSFLFGGRPRNRRQELMTQGQQDLLDQLIAQIQGGTGGFGFDENFFQRTFTDPAMRQFENRIAPGIQQQFIGMGAQRSSGLEDELTRAGADVQGQLGQQRADLLNQALSRQLQGANLALGARPFGIEQDPGTTGLIPEILSGIGGGFAGGFGQQAGRGAAGAFNRRVGFR